MTVMGSITTVAKQRPTFFGKVVQAFETLQGKKHDNVTETAIKGLFYKTKHFGTGEVTFKIHIDQGIFLESLLL